MWPSITSMWEKPKITQWRWHTSEDPFVEAKSCLQNQGPWPQLAWSISADHWAMETSCIKCSHGAGFKDMMWKPSWKRFVFDSLKLLQASLYLLHTRNGLSALRLHQNSSKADRISKIFADHLIERIGEIAYTTCHPILHFLNIPQDWRQWQFPSVSSPSLEPHLILSQAIQDFGQLIAHAPGEEKGNQSRLPPWPSWTK